MTEISWKKCILSPDNSVRDAIDILIASSKRIVLVVSEDVLLLDEELEEVDSDVLVLVVPVKEEVVLELLVVSEELELLVV